MSDFALKQPLPAEVMYDVQADVGCIAGAILPSEYEQRLRHAGFETVVVQDTGANLNAYATAGTNGCSSAGSCCPADAATPPASPVHDGLAELLSRVDANEYAASVRVHALKPGDPSVQEPTMKTIQVYDKPMCCSTGVCGPDVDPVLPQFAADLQWLKSQGHQVERYNLAQQPQAFLQNPTVHQLLATEGTNPLPLVLVNGVIVSRQVYPTRDQLTGWTGSPRTETAGCCDGPPKNAGHACCAADEQTQATAGTGCDCGTTGCC